MPYSLRFTKPLTVVDRGRYINHGCIGGDQVIERLLPALEVSYGRVRCEQENGGWFAWFERNGRRLAVDVHTEDDRACEFEMHLTSHTRTLLFGSKVQDTAELEELRDLVAAELRAWHVDRLAVERIDGTPRPA